MREQEKSTTIYFIRHAKPDFPSDRIYCDARENPALTVEGQQQAETSAEYLANESIEVIYASPLARACQTADYLAKRLEIEIKTDPNLQERAFGIWDGLYFSEIEQQYPDQYQAWKRDQVGFTPEGGETMRDVSARVERVLHEIIQRHQGGTVAIFTHMGPIRLAVTRAFEIPMTQYRQIRVDYGGISRIDYGVSRNNLIFLNRLFY